MSGPETAQQERVQGAVRQAGRSRDRGVYCPKIGRVSFKWRTWERAEGMPGRRGNDFLSQEEGPGWYLLQLLFSPSLSNHYLPLQSLEQPFRLHSPQGSPSPLPDSPFPWPSAQ